MIQAGGVPTGRRRATVRAGIRPCYHARTTPTANLATSRPVACGVTSFRERVLTVVRSVPAGRVVTYGQVAMWAGSPRSARQVGAVLFGLREADGDVPWQRVVNARGGISTFRVGAGELQVALLRSEGVEVSANGLDLARWRWEPPPDTWTWVVPTAP